MTVISLKRSVCVISCVVSFCFVSAQGVVWCCAEMTRESGALCVWILSLLNGFEGILIVDSEFCWEN